MSDASRNDILRALSDSFWGYCFFRVGLVITNSMCFWMFRSSVVLHQVVEKFSGPQYDVYGIFKGAYFLFSMVVYGMSTSES